MTNTGHVVLIRNQNPDGKQKTRLTVNPNIKQRNHEQSRRIKMRTSLEKMLCHPFRCERGVHCSCCRLGNQKQEEITEETMDQSGFSDLQPAVYLIFSEADIVDLQSGVKELLTSTDVDVQITCSLRVTFHHMHIMF